MTPEQSDSKHAATPQTETDGEPVPNIFERVIPLLREMIRQCDWQKPPALPAVGATTLPPWVVRVCGKLARTVLKPARNFEVGENLDFRLIGRLVGFMLRAAYWGLVEAPKEVEALGLDKLNAEKQARINQASDLAPLRATLLERTGSPPDTTRTNEQLLESAVEQFLIAQSTNVIVLVMAALKQPPGLMVEFLRGLPEGYASFLTEKGELKGDRGRTNVYFALATFWPEIEALRTNGGISRERLYTVVCQMDDTVLGDRPDWFEDVCEEVGLSLREPGAPRKK